MDPFRHKEKGRLGQLDRKKAEEENKKKKAKKKRERERPLMAQIEKASGNQDREEE